MAYPFGVGLGVVVVPLEGTDHVPSHDLTDGLMAIDQSARCVEDGRRTLAQGGGVDDGQVHSGWRVADRVGRRPEGLLGADGPFTRPVVLQELAPESAGEYLHVPGRRLGPEPQS